MVIGVTQNYQWIYLGLAIFKYLIIVALGTRTILTNKLHRASLKLFQLKNAQIKIKINLYRNILEMS